MIHEALLFFLTFKLCSTLTITFLNLFLSISWVTIYAKYICPLVFHVSIILYENDNIGHPVIVRQLMLRVKFLFESGFQLSHCRVLWPGPGTSWDPGQVTPVSSVHWQYNNIYTSPVLCNPLNSDPIWIWSKSRYTFLNTNRNWENLNILY